MTATARPPWPTAVEDALRARHGPPLATLPLGGMSGARVFRVRFATASAIVKAARTAEARFYERVAATLREHGVPVPDCQGSLAVDGDHWLILEDVPHPLPRDRWHADAAVLGVLGRLHAATWGRPLDVPGAFVPAWPDEATAAALSCFPTAIARDLASPLVELQRESQDLFRPLCSISGDPNPTNWGLRADGTAVLYDWERFGAGTPALDLAITVPGLGDPAAYAAVADGYLRNWPDGSHPLSWTPEQWSRAVAVAKLWSVVEFLHAHGRQVGGNTTATVERILPDVPNWVQELASVPGTR
jgi:Ser/Thr protein kinase RdoA (MazF antagonist)